MFGEGDKNAPFNALSRVPTLHGGEALIESASIVSMNWSARKKARTAARGPDRPLR
jgi:hypothetical protein